jgi:hypothetical protein
MPVHFKTTPGSSMEGDQLFPVAGSYELSLAIRLTLDFDSVLQKLADATVGNTQVDGDPMLLPIEEENAPRVAVVRGEGKRIPFSRALARRVDRRLKRVSCLNKFGDVKAAFPLCTPQVPARLYPYWLAAGSWVFSCSASWGGEQDLRSFFFVPKNEEIPEIGDHTLRSVDSDRWMPSARSQARGVRLVAIQRLNRFFFPAQFPMIWL